MAHNSSCGNSKARQCHCGGCGGARHGWPGALALTAPSRAGDRNALRLAAEGQWAQAEQAGRRRRQPGRRRARAAVDGARADIVQWLSGEVTDPSPPPPAAVNQLVAQLGDLVSGEVYAALRESLGGRDNDRTRGDFAKKHLFCALMAATACSMQRFADDLDEAAEKIAAKMAATCIGQQKSGFPVYARKIVAQATVDGMDKIVHANPAAQHFDNLLQAARILGILMCPAPEKHREVVECCLKPLTEPLLSAEVQLRLKEALPDWMR